MGKHTNGYHGPTNTPADRDPDHDEEFDALADLFLSDHPSGSARDRRPAPAIDDDFDDSPDVEGVATLKFVGEQAVQAPARRSPAPARRAAKPRPVSVPAPLAGDRNPMPQTHGVRLEMLVLGHLPVMSSAWATQYAQSIVDAEAQPVACLRLASGYASLDVFGIGRQLDPAETIEAAIAKAASLTDRWVIRADAPSEPALSLRPEITEVTLLVGSNEAAVVAAYRTIKGLVGSNAAITEDTGRKRLRVAVMGASEEAADTAFTKIAHTVEVYLGQSIDRAPSVEKVRPAPSASLYRGTIAGAGSELIDQLLDALEETGLGAGSFQGDPDLAERRVVHEPALREPAHEPAAEEDEAPIRPLLAAQLEGLNPLRARCPFEPLVEFAFDHDGRLHALEHADHATVSSLLTATSWAAQHAELIGQTLDAQGRVRPGMAPTMHVFTDRPSAVRRLLDTEVRVHLLNSVDVDGRVAWCCTDLN
jgi:hypothetical protein